jgi:hypothetical protein
MIVPAGRLLRGKIMKLAALRVNLTKLPHTEELYREERAKIQVSPRHVLVLAPPEL